MKKFTESAHFGLFGSNPFLKPVQTRTIRRGALRFATQISPLLNFIIFTGWPLCKRSQWRSKFSPRFLPTKDQTTQHLEKPINVLFVIASTWALYILSLLHILITARVLHDSFVFTNMFLFFFTLFLAGSDRLYQV